MKFCKACGKETDELYYPPATKWGQSDDLLCKECLEPCSCKGGFRANCTCDTQYDQERDKHLGSLTFEGIE